MRNLWPRPRTAKQTGSGILLFFLILGVGMLAVLVSRLSVLSPRSTADEISAATLRAGSIALMSWALARRDDRRAPPGLLPYPDRHADGNYDGRADCPPNLGQPSTNHSLRLGKLPVAGEPSGTPCEGEDHGSGRRITLSVDARDGQGDIVWYAVSHNLVDDTHGRAYRGNVDGFQALTPAALKSAKARANWLTICNGDGTVLTREAAFVLISPGAPHTTQNREPPAPPASAYLDTITLPGTQPPCGGSQTHQSNQRVFVAAAPTAQFNDRLLYISADQFIDQLAVRTIASVRRELDRFVSTHPEIGYPHPAASDGQPCNPTLSEGRIPLSAGQGCAGLTSWPSWDIPSDPTSWHAYLHYRRISGAEVVLSIVGCNDTFTLRRSAGTATSLLSRENRRC